MLKKVEDKKIVTKESHVSKKLNLDLIQENEKLIKKIADIDINNNLINNIKNIDLKTEPEMKDATKTTLKKKRGRNPIGCSGGSHTKFSDDNIRRKCKHLVLKNVFDFTNNKIKSIYSNTNKE